MGQQEALAKGLNAKVALGQLVHFFPGAHPIRSTVERLFEKPAWSDPQTAVQRAREMVVLIEMKALEFDVRAGFWRRIVKVADALDVPYDAEVYDSRFRNRLKRGSTDPANKKLN